MKKRPTKKYRARPFATGLHSDQGLPGKQSWGSVGRQRLFDRPLHFLFGLHKWYIALKYQLFRVSGGLLGKGRFPWIKIGVLAIAVFLLFKKDIVFTINLGGLKQSAAQTGRSNAAPADRAKVASEVEEMGIGKRFSRKPSISQTSIASVADLSDQAVEAYIDRFLKVAKMEYKKYNIPVSIKLAQGLAESQAGMNEAAIKENNHFGDAMQVMTYHTAWENWRAHSVLLHRSYPELFELPSNDYVAWARGLKKAGYSRHCKYDEVLIEIIQAFQLDQYDA